jgi:hypothetical protein
MLCVACCLFAISPGEAAAQAVPAATWPTGDTSPADQPLPGQMLGTNLTLNQGANAIAAENESFDRFGLGLQATGGAITNFFGSQTNQQTAGYIQFTADAGVFLRSSRTRYFLLYQPQYNVYPQFSQVNSYGQSAFQTLTHQLTEHNAIEWDMTGARYMSLNEFLPQNLSIGNIGIVVPTLAQKLLEDSFQITNAATSVHLRTLLSERLTFDGTITGGFFLLVPNSAAHASPSATERFVTSGADLKLSYQLTPRDIVGGEATPIFIYGLSPGGHEVAEVVQGIYQRQLTATLSASVGAGPLFIQSSSPVYGRVRATSYAINAALTRSLRQSQFAVLYSRAFVVNLLSPAIASNSFGGSAYVPLKGHWIAFGAGNYVHDSGTSTYGGATIYGGSGELAYQVQTKFQLFARYSVSSQSFNEVTGQQPYSFVRNQIGGGIRFNLGNPTTAANTTGGVQ